MLIKKNDVLIVLFCFNGQGWQEKEICCWPLLRRLSVLLLSELETYSPQLKDKPSRSNGIIDWNIFRCVAASLIRLSLIFIKLFSTCKQVLIYSVLAGMQGITLVATVMKGLTGSVWHKSNSIQSIILTEFRNTEISQCNCFSGEQN